MARRRSYEPLRVYLNSRLVGQLRRERSGAIEFQYDAEWLDAGAIRQSVFCSNKSW